jgi:TolB-like protein/Flp pilus assembly protein TadD
MRTPYLEPGTRFNDRYQIIEELETHDSGTNYKAYDQKIQSQVSLNFINLKNIKDPETKKDIQTKLNRAQTFSHKNICRIFQFTQDGHELYFSREYVPGEKLKNIIHMTKGLNPDAALDIISQVGEGIRAARKHGLSNLHISTEKIIVDIHGTARIIPFGPGTEMPATSASETYILGAILFEMLTGQSFKKKKEKILHKAIPRELRSILKKCLQPRKKAQYKDINEVLSAFAKIKNISKKKNPDKYPVSAVWKPMIYSIRRRWIQILALFTAIAVIGIYMLALTRSGQPVASNYQKIVVLPFENLGTPENDYFTEGVTKEISNRLASLPDLAVISQISAQQFQHSSRTTKEIGKELNVDYILCGSVRWDRDSYDQAAARITPKLIRTRDDSQIWSRTYDRNIADIFLIQSEIAEEIARQLDLAILEPQRQALRKKPTDNVEAYELFIGSIQHENMGWMKSDPEEFHHALDLLSQAVTLDPDFAIAYSKISYLHSLMYFFGYDHSPERMEQARMTAEKALSLDKDNPDIMHTKALYYYWCHQDYEQAEKIYKQIFKIRPNHRSAILGYIYRRQGNWDKCIQELKRCAELDPLYSQLNYEIGLCYLAIGHYREAEQWFNQALSFNSSRLTPQLGKAAIPVLEKGDTTEARAMVENIPQHELTDFMHITLDLIDGRYQDIKDRLEVLPYDSFSFQHSYYNKDLVKAAVYFAEKETQSQQKCAQASLIELKELTSSFPNDPRYHAALGLAYAYAGENEKAENAGLQAVRLLPADLDAAIGPVFLHNLARIYSITGEKDKAVSQLAHLLSVPYCEYLWDLVSIPYLQIDPQWDSLRSHPGFQQLAATVPASPRNN